MSDDTPGGSNDQSTPYERLNAIVIQTLSAYLVDKKLPSIDEIHEGKIEYAQAIQLYQTLFGYGDDEGGDSEMILSQKISQGNETLSINDMRNINDILRETMGDMKRRILLLIAKKDLDLILAKDYRPPTSSTPTPRMPTSRYIQSQPHKNLLQVLSHPIDSISHPTTMLRMRIALLKTQKTTQGALIYTLGVSHDGNNRQQRAYMPSYPYVSPLCDQIEIAEWYPKNNDRTAIYFAEKKYLYLLRPAEKEQINRCMYMMYEYAKNTNRPLPQDAKHCIGHLIYRYMIDNLVEYDTDKNDFKPGTEKHYSEVLRYKDMIDEKSCQAFQQQKQGRGRPDEMDDLLDYCIDRASDYAAEIRKKETEENIPIDLAAGVNTKFIYQMLELFHKKHYRPTSIDASRNFIIKTKKRS